MLKWFIINVKLYIIRIVHSSDKAKIKKEREKANRKRSRETDRSRLVQWERIADDLAVDDITARLKGLLDWLICTYASENMMLTCVSICSISATHTQVRVLLVWMIGKIVAFPHRFSSLPPLHSKYGLVCLSCLSSPHFFPLFVLLFLFFHPAFCSLLFFPSSCSCAAGSKVLPGEHKGLEQPGFLTKSVMLNCKCSSEDTYNLWLIYTNVILYKIGVWYRHVVYSMRCKDNFSVVWCAVCGLVSLNLRLSQVAGHMSWLSVQRVYVHIQCVRTESEWRLN